MRVLDEYTVEPFITTLKFPDLYQLELAVPAPFKVQAIVVVLLATL
jgi:hypothetical protein